jgi:glycosidase
MILRKLFPLLVMMTLAPSACVDLPDDGKPQPIKTWVNDWRDEVVYQVLVDRFADGDVNNDYLVRPGALARYQGGDWKGLQDHLDYIKELGVTTLWISPVIKNVETDADVDAYHGYWAQDLTQTNPHFGDMADLRAFVRAAHGQGLKVVLDIVTNHMGQVFFYDMNLNGKADIYIGGTGGTSPVTRVSEFDPDWDPTGVQASTSLGLAGRAPIVFIQDPSINRVPPQPGILGTARAYHGFGRILKYDVEAQTRLGDFPGGLKDVATELPEVRATMVDAYTRWAELVDLDGFRIDTVKHVEHEFWQVFAPAVRQRLAAQGKNKFLMFGEAFDGNDELLGSFTKNNELDSVFYFSQHYEVFRNVFQRGKDARALKTQSGTDQIEKLWTARYKNWGAEPMPDGVGIPPRKMPINFMDNHDVARFLFDAKGDVDALRNALTLLSTEEGIPCIYYGTEQDFAGGNDPANREVLWQTGFSTTGDTFRHISKLMRLRKAYVALRRGDLKVVWASPDVDAEEDAGILAYERAGGDAGAGAYALVVLNTNGLKESATAKGGTSMKTSLPSTVLVDVLDPKRPTFTTGADGSLRVSVAAQRGMILIPQAAVVSE